MKFADLAVSAFLIPVPARVAGLVRLCDLERVPPAYRADKDDRQHAQE